MIDIQVRIRDKFSVEFKTGLVVDGDEPQNDFIINTWIFIPYSLDINAVTYPKNHFYRDATSYVRLITPIYSLEEIADEQSLPDIFLETAFNELLIEPSDENMAEFEYQIKMFCSIVKSALREEANHLLKIPDESECLEATDVYVRRIEKITRFYRNLKREIEGSGVPEKAQTYYSFGDEFLSNRIEHKTFEVIKCLSAGPTENKVRMKKKLMELIRKEKDYRIMKGYQVIDAEYPGKNSVLLQRLRLLRKYIESHLFFTTDRKKDGRLVEQVSFSIAAGLAMVFATAIAFSAQQKYGNFTMPLFVVLVASYMLKDRIKEIVRYYFVSRLSKKYFDNKTTISLKNDPIGWIKEGVDFVPEMKVPQDIIRRRNRDDILESDNRNTSEKIILYRKRLHINGRSLNSNMQYDVAGINDIFRFNFSSFLMKMDDSLVPVFVAENDECTNILCKFSYYMNFIIELRNKDSVQLTQFRFTVSRDGIEHIDQL